MDTKDVKNIAGAAGAIALVAAIAKRDDLTGPWATDGQKALYWGGLVAGVAGLGFYTYKTFYPGAPQLATGKAPADSNQNPALSPEEKIALWKRVSSNSYMLPSVNGKYATNSIALANSPVPKIENSAAIPTIAMNVKSYVAFGKTDEGDILMFLPPGQNVPAGFRMFLAPGDYVSVSNAAGVALPAVPDPSLPAKGGTQKSAFGESGANYTFPFPGGIVNPADYFPLPVSTTPSVPMVVETPMSNSQDTGTIWHTQGGGMFVDPNSY